MNILCTLGIHKDILTMQTRPFRGTCTRGNFFSSRIYDIALIGSKFRCSRCKRIDYRVTDGHTQTSIPLEWANTLDWHNREAPSTDV